MSNDSTWWWESEVDDSVMFSQESDEVELSDQSTATQSEEPIADPRGASSHEASEVRCVAFVAIIIPCSYIL